DSCCWQQAVSHLARPLPKPIPGRAGFRAMASSLGQVVSPASGAFRDQAGSQDSAATPGSAATRAMVAILAQAACLVLAAFPALDQAAAYPGMALTRALAPVARQPQRRPRRRTYG